MAVLQDGVLQQVDRQRAMHDRPANVFVGDERGFPVVVGLVEELGSDASCTRRSGAGSPTTRCRPAPLLVDLGGGSDWPSPAVLFTRVSFREMRLPHWFAVWPSRQRLQGRRRRRTRHD